MLFNKAVLTEDHYSHFYYSEHFPVVNEEHKEVVNVAKVLGRYPDILYSSSYDGEIVIEWSEKQK